MGAACMISVYAPAHAEKLTELGRMRVEILEQSWSRFRESSELKRVNACAGSGPMVVSADMLTLVWHMKRAWEITGGLFDPTMLSEIKAAGYDADYASVIARGALAGIASWNQEAVSGAEGTSAIPTTRVSFMNDVNIDLEASTISLPAGVGLDPGAIGKGLGADIVAHELMEAGASGVLVDLGGDIVVAGKPGDADAWVIAIEDERDPNNAAREPQLVTCNTRSTNDEHETFGIATSSTLYRRWAGGTRHHVIDPRTGQMADPDLIQATVWCGAGWLAEVTATAAMLMKPDAACAWLTTHDAGYTVMTPTQMWSSLEKVQHG